MSGDPHILVIGGVAQVYGGKLKGYPAGLMHRTYHVSPVPIVNRKTRVVPDWTLGLFFRREAVSLGALQDPQRGFREVAGPAPSPEAVAPPSER